VSVPVTVPSFYAAYFSGMPGPIGTELAGVTVSGASTVPLTCKAIGGRVAQLGECFQMFRVKRMAVRYRTNLGSDGSVPSGILGTSVTYAANSLCFGVTSDPAFAPVSYANAVEYGGAVTSVARNKTFMFRGDLDQMDGWRYTQSDVSAGTSQARFADVGTIFAFWYQLPGANVTNPFGMFLLDMDVEFKHPQDNQLSGPSALASRIAELGGSESPVEQKTPRSGVLVCTPTPLEILPHREAVPGRPPGAGRVETKKDEPQKKFKY